MMRRFAIAIFLLLTSIVSSSQNFNFTPIVRNFSTADYGSSRQNWSLTQGHDGVIYVGNNTCLLEYDNSVWSRHMLPGKELVRAVHFSPDGKIYCGAYHEFGYFEKIDDSLIYNSISALVPELVEDHDEVWNIITDPYTGKVIFQTFSSLFIYDGETVTVVRDLNPLNILKVGNVLYSQVIDGDFVMLQGGAEVKVVVPKEKNIGQVTAAFEHDGGLLLLTETNGCFLFKEGEVSPWRTEADALLKEHQINRAVETPDGRYIIGTLSGGIFSIASDGSLEWMIDVSGGLQNNTVLALLCDYSGNIWVALDDGISYIDRTAGVYVYRPQNHNIGMIYDMLIDGNDTYLATNQGLYFSSDGSGLKRVSGLDEQTWFIEKINSTIYCGYNVGVFSIKDHKAELVSEEGGGTFCIRKIAHKDSTFILAGTYSMPCLYKEKGNGEWEYLPTFENNLQMLRNIEYDGQGNIWGEHFKSGLVRLSLSPDFRSVTEEMKYSTLGEVSDTVFNVMNINGRVVFTNGRRFFTYESVHDEIVPYEVMNRDLNELKNVHQAVHVKDSYYWLVGDRRITLVECRKDSFRVIRSLPYSLFGISVEERSSVICDSSTGNTYLLMSNLIVRIDDAVFMHPIRDSYIPLELVSMTAADREGTVINVPLTDGVRIGYRYNTVDFRLRYPVYSGFDINMRCRLDGLTDEWVYRGRDLAQKFTRLRSGKYVFEAEVYAGEEVLATTSIDFVIRKPWYASWWMLFVYVVLASIVYGIFYQMSVRKMKAENRRRIEEQKLKMQQQKEAMLEEDVRQKSKDLASMSMAVIAHNEVLDSILKEINEQRSGKITRTLDKIQHIVQNSLISNNEQWDVFQANFDRIHENFFRKLKDRYPDLTSTDLRLCALLRLNLSTKEIANMLNLTIRGVESARYRLRKKLELPAEASLTDFMINFK